MSPIHFRTASLDDLDTMLDWAAAEGWNPGLDDAKAFYSADPAGFFVAEIDGHPIAAISVVNHSPDFAFLGFYICAPGYRGQGIGLALWKHALEHAGTRTVGLDGVADQEANYARSGFVRTGATLRFEGSLPGKPDASARPVTEQDRSALARLDIEANDVKRPRFLTSWINDTANRHSLVLEDAGQITGFATLRRCRNGAKVGPVVARDAAAALRLVQAGLTFMPAAPVIIDLPDSNTDLIGILTDLGFQETFATARMYRGTPPKPSVILQAIASMELG
ncbi:GNAT family N-acetyltransferase [Phycobacter sp. K97]|uniref:GNAT family N-acetyltransferase n=1 Tax=Phycobacter sedimenti TaxID=3133977 RepID=UPI00311E2D49